MNNSLLQLYYEKYRKNMISVSVIVVSFFIILQVIIPQFSNIATNQNEITTKREELKKSQSSLSVVQSNNASQVTDSLETSLAALPSTKNISAIFEALSFAAGKTNTEIANFTIEVGSLYSKTGPIEENTTQGVPSLNVDVKVLASSSASLVAFANELYSQFPLAEIDIFSSTSQEAVFAIRFFYRPIDENSLKNQENVEALTNEERSLLRELEELNN